jgi:hemolysin III
MPQTHLRHLSLEELLNSITHGIGLALSIAGFVALLILAITRGTGWQIASCAIYGTTLVALYTASTLYHGIPAPTLKRVLRILDHSAIYLLIAGTYTPFLLVNLRGPLGWTLLAIVWTLAIAGILLKIWFVERLPILSTLVYLLMGWLALIAIKPLIAAVPHSGLAWLLAGGASPSPLLPAFSKLNRNGRPSQRRPSISLPRSTRVRSGFLYPPATSNYIFRPANAVSDGIETDTVTESSGGCVPL